MRDPNYVVLYLHVYIPYYFGCSWVEIDNNDIYKPESVPICCGIKMFKRRKLECLYINLHFFKTKVVISKVCPRSLSGTTLSTIV